MERFGSAVNEGLDPVTKAAGLMLLRYVAGGKREFQEMLTLVRSASAYFEHTLRRILKRPGVATYDELLDLGVMKKKIPTLRSIHGRHLHLSAALLQRFEAADAFNGPCQDGANPKH
ncbi:MAG: hypothetical protein QXJ09_07535 [Candidatus Caldarchaeum sp.]